MTSIRILTSSHVDQILTKLSPDLALSSQSHVFKSFSRPKPLRESQKYDVIQTPHRITINSENSTMLFMPSRAPTTSSSSDSTSNTPGEGGNSSDGSATTSIKIVSNPQNGIGGLPATTLVMNENTGKVKAIVNARKLTALRNACGSALFLQQFPNPTPPKHLILFGSGAQCHSHAILFLRLHQSIEQVTFVIRSNTSRSDSLIRDLSNQFPNVSISTSIHSSSSSEGLDKLVESGDIIITATSSTEPLFKTTETTPKIGSRIILIGSYKPTMHEIDSTLIKKASLIVVDSKDACLRESGEFIDAGLGKDDLVELGEVLDDIEQNNSKGEQKVKDRAGGDGIIIFKSVGLGIQDVAITNLVLEEAERLNLGNIVENYD